MKKREVKAAMKEHGIKGKVRGSGKAWTVVLPTMKALRKFQKFVAMPRGFETAEGWILSPAFEAGY